QVSPIDAQHSPDDMVVFYEEFSTVLNSTIKAMRIATDGSFLWTPAQAFVSSLQSEKGKAVATKFHNNQWVLSWEDSRTGNRDIYAQNIQLNADLGPYNPEYGYIEGTVNLNGGNGNVTQVLISAGSYTTYPDPTGFYSFEVQTGTYTVNASLAGYYPESIDNVIVLNDQTTANVNFTLDPIPTHGFIEGIVTLIGGEGDVALTEVRAGNFITNPDETGYYTMELAVGTWSVEASLAGYYTSVLDNVVVEPGLTTSDVDFNLTPLPPMGYIEGVVTLLGGPGNVADVVVSNGFYITNPDQSGYYTLESEPGTYTVTASLSGYITQQIEDVAVLDGQTTLGIDFELPLSPASGFIEGHIILVGGTADVTLTSVKAGSFMTYADEDGYYLLATAPGEHLVEAANPYTDTQVIEGVVVVGGETTPDVDFMLNITHADLICYAYDSDHNILNQVQLTIIGQDSTYTGLIENDSLVFYHVPFGEYHGNASYLDHTTTSIATIDSENSLISFIFTTVDAKTIAAVENITIFPNPLKQNQPLKVLSHKQGSYKISLLNNLGSKLLVSEDVVFSNGYYTIDLSGMNFKSGIYYLIVWGKDENYSMKLILY
ncbi:MAG: carboxypeptidase regulatory-like domain-containing protein, partial [Bacteroidales bacterium]|nr:carboxypeptidase regulatory-like domain-containing protein [Bacteroidales bacterium]